jgi:acetylornithine deacetylase
MFNNHSTTPAILFGPRGGNPHSTDEYVEIEDFLHTIEVFARLAIRWTDVG